MLQHSGRRRCGGFGFTLVVLTTSLGLWAIGPAASQAPGSSAATGPERSRLLGLQREAVSLLQQANAANDWRKSLLDASRQLEALGAEPGPGATSTSLIAVSAARRAASRRGRARDDRENNAAGTHGPPPRPLPPTAREGAAAARRRGRAGLDLPGKLSARRRRRSPAYGGHASAMGPAPAPPPSPDDGSPSPVTFEEPARLATKTYCGGADKRPHPRIGVRRASRWSTTTATAASTSIW